MFLSLIMQKKSIEDLEKKLRTKPIELSKVELRNKVNIAVIDDEVFQPSINLQNHGFSLKHFPDINDVKLVKDYQIVLCDLQGVGQLLDPDNQGAHLIKEIKTSYPEKYVIAYTGGASHSNLAKLGNDFADAYIKKDADIPTWLEKLDSAINEVTDPVVVWRNFRDRLLREHRLPLSNIIPIEDAYVRICLKKKPKDPEKVVYEAFKNSDVSSIKNPVEDFIKSPVFKVAVDLAHAYIGLRSND